MYLTVAISPSLAGKPWPGLVIVLMTPSGKVDAAGLENILVVALLQFDDRLGENALHVDARMTTARLHTRFNCCMIEI